MYELTESEEVEGQPFHNLDPDVLVKALKTLELQNEGRSCPLLLPLAFKQQIFTKRPGKRGH